MHIDTRRLLAGLQESVDGLAALSDTPLAKTFQAAANSMLAELQRRENEQALRDNYARGVEIARNIAAAMKAGAVSTKAQIAALPTSMNAGISVEGAYALYDQLRAELTQLVADSGYPQAKMDAINAAIMALYDWEFAVSRPPAPPQQATQTRLDMKAVLEKSTRLQGGVLANARLTNIVELHGGYGKATTLFEIADDKQQPWRLVARATKDIPLLDLPAQNIGKEYYMLRYAHRHGICVAEPMWLEDDKAVHGVRFLVSRQVSGRNLGSAIGSEPLNAAQVKSLAIELAKIHNMTLDAADLDMQKSVIDPAEAKKPLPVVVGDYLHFWRNFWQRARIGQYPVVEATFNWLLANLPDPDDVPVFLHGDYALHNILIEGDAVSGVLDWEMHHLGDRAEDISWLLSSISKHVSQEQFMTEYVAAGGRAVSNFQLRYYEVLVHLKLVIVALESQLRMQQLPHAGPHYSILGLTFIQHPLGNLERAIREAEASR